MSWVGSSLERTMHQRFPPRTGFLVPPASEAADRRGDLQEGLVLLAQNRFLQPLAVSQYSVSKFKVLPDMRQRRSAPFPGPSRVVTP